MHPAAPCCTLPRTLVYPAVLCSSLDALLYSAVLCCTLLYSAVLCCTLLYSAVLCCTCAASWGPCSHVPMLFLVLFALQYLLKGYLLYGNEDLRSMFSEVSEGVRIRKSVVLDVCHYLLYAYLCLSLPAVRGTRN